MGKNFIRIFIIIIVLAVIITFVILFTNKKSQQAPQPTITTPLPKPIKIDSKNQPTMGDPNAPIRIIAFEDLKCVACMGYNVNLFPQIKKQLIDTHQAKYTVINLAFIPGSMQAANTAHCLYDQNPDYFFQFVAYIYHHQGQENENWATIPLLLKYANMIKGVDSDKLSDCVMQSPYTNFILNNLNLAQTAMGTSIKTPSIYVNGIVVDPLNMAQINRIISHIKQQTGK